MNSLRKNILLKGILTFSNYIIGFVTFPYITRVLGPNNFGLVNFALNTIDYFLLFATMGIVTIGTREIAAVRDNREALNSVFSKIFGVNLFFTAITLVIYFTVVLLIPKLYENRELLYIGSAKIIFTVLAVEWFFTGTENFSYITYRSLVIKIIYVIVVFLFVKNKSDYLLYFTLTIISIVVNAIVNFIYAGKFIKLRVYKFSTKKYLIQNLRLGIYAVMSSMYITFNVMYLGLVSTDAEVGYYSTAVKLYFIAVSLFGAFTQVMMPRVSSLLSEGYQNKVDAYLKQSYTIVFLLSFPIIIITEFYAPVVINIISGPGYLMSVTPMRILMPALLFVWLAQVIAIQALVPMQKDKLLLIASIVGGCLAIVINLILTTQLASLGSALTLVVCEVCVTSVYLIVCGHKHLIPLPSIKFLSDNIIRGIPYLIINLVIVQIDDDLIGLLFSCLLCGVYFIILRPMKLLHKDKLEYWF